ncbi:MAG: peptide-methionine (R)-S-oxide reductase MsrB [Oscillospiraceae bacterium]|jgi:peptide methionine sulfoxide reductase msrA/msrB|nr:peptide-methionine (R)-S-oxide reductase MsrB [Oscillospiraceae bacterium]
MKTIYIAGGCFWGVQKYLDSLYGVTETEVGYANGDLATVGGAPVYDQVKRGDTQFAETVRVRYDERDLPLSFLLEAFYDVIDVTSVNRQGADVGTQYRTGIYYSDAADKSAIEQSLANLARRMAHERPNQAVAVECRALDSFFTAEEYHQKYLDKNPSGYCHISPASFAKAAARRAVPLPTPSVGRNADNERVDHARYSAPTDDDLKNRLTPEQYAVTQTNATEAPFGNAYWDERRRGIYVDITTGEPLFASSDKFDSGCGWPSFSRPIDTAVLRARLDETGTRQRTEIRSRVGDAHLGHVFDDGPATLGGLRYCINSAALRFVPIEDMEREGYGALVDLAG